MQQTFWPESFADVLRRHLPLLGDDGLAPATNLADAGLDSLATVALLVELEGTFDVLVPDELLTADTFGTAGALWTVLAELGAA